MPGIRYCVIVLYVALYLEHSLIAHPSFVCGRGFLFSFVVAVYGKKNKMMKQDQPPTPDYV